MFQNVAELTRFFIIFPYSWPDQVCFSIMITEHWRFAYDIFKSNFTRKVSYFDFSYVSSW